MFQFEWRAKNATQRAVNGMARKKSVERASIARLIARSHLWAVWDALALVKDSKVDSSNRNGLEWRAKEDAQRSNGMARKNTVGRASITALSVGSNSWSIQNYAVGDGLDFGA